MSSPKNNYLAMPAVISEGKEHTITLSGKVGSFPIIPRMEYELEISAVLEGYIRDYPERHNQRKLKVRADSRGRLTFTAAFSGEQEHFIWIWVGRMRLGKASVYSVSGALIGRFPYRGDLHIHTKRSDGRYRPPYVCAYYRTAGYDFMTVSDHKKYYPSLEAIDKFAKVKTELNIVAGEEVHMPGTDLHVVNFGGKYSVNGIWEGSENYKAKGADKAFRSRGMEPPKTLSTEEYEKEISAIEETLTVPDGVNKRSYAVLLWICDHIKRGNGLSIYAHPCWLNMVRQVPPSFHDYIMENQPFGAYEVLGGEVYFEHNGFQTVSYYEDREKGRHYPIVGSTDSHNCKKRNKRSRICSTVVFAKENTREDIIDGILNFRSVAVDTISREFRLVGDMRLVQYTSFLMNNFYPIQNKIAKKEGKRMIAYLRLPHVFAPILNRRFGAEKRLMDKFFEF